jgi:signal transduction histidine kinase
MQQLEQAGGPEAGRGNVRHQRVETVVHTLATLGGRSESLAEVAHDARNMVTALALYCDLLDEPGVLAAPFAHYSGELRLVAAASRRLVEKLVALDTLLEARPEVPAGESAAAARSGPDTPAESGRRGRDWEGLFVEPIRDLAAEVVANRNLLAALAGPGVAVTVDADQAALPVRLTAEDLTRLLVNLVKNAAEAMPSGGKVGVLLRELPAGEGEPAQLVLMVEDSGPGIAPEALERIFESGYSTHPAGMARNGGWPVMHRGLGLAIARSLVESAGGRIAAANRVADGGQPDQASQAGVSRSGCSGARFTIELPVWEPATGDELTKALNQELL